MARSPDLLSQLLSTSQATAYLSVREGQASKRFIGIEPRLQPGRILMGILSGGQINGADLLLFGAIILIIVLWLWGRSIPEPHRVVCMNCGDGVACSPDGTAYCQRCGQIVWGENLQRQRQEQQQPAPPAQPTTTFQIIQPAQSPQVKEVYRETVREIVKIRCRHCGTLFEEKLSRCPHCGAPS